MIDQIFSSFFLIANSELLLTALLGIFLGIIFGILPGFGGLTTLALLLPFTFTMEPYEGIIFLLATHVAIDIGGLMSAIILGIPGSVGNAATVTDGYAFTKENKIFYAIGAALMASVLGGLFGAFLLALFLPLLQPVILAFGSAEIFLITLFGLIYYGLFGTKKSPLKGVIAIGLGLFISTIGYQRISGEPRFWFDLEMMIDGIPLVPMVLGLFAIPEIIQLFSAKKSSHTKIKRKKEIYMQLFNGAVEVIKRPLLVLRSSTIGMIVGIIPGIGGSVAPFLALSTIKRTDNKHQIEGVIAPESSNNAKEGGALVPTLALGIPGSAGMVLLLGGFIIMGIEPGPQFLKENMNFAIGLSWVVALSNVVAAILVIPLIAKIIKITYINQKLLGIIIALLVLYGTYFYQNSFYDLIYLFVFGILGIIMQNLDYNRPALILGFILGPLLETYFHISIQAYGVEIFQRPISLGLIILILLGVVKAIYDGRKNVK